MIRTRKAQCLVPTRLGPASDTGSDESTGSRHKQSHSSSASVCIAASRSERVGFSRAQVIARSGSSQRTPADSAGTYSVDIMIEQAAVIC